MFLSKSHQHYGVIMYPLYLWLIIRSFMLEQNILRLITTLFEKKLFAKISYSLHLFQQPTCWYTHKASLVFNISSPSRQTIDSTWVIHLREDIRRYFKIYRLLLLFRHFTVNWYNFNFYHTYSFVICINVATYEWEHKQ